MRFLADEMLGRLVRWLRLLGHDAAYARDAKDTEILARARAEGRILLTRDVQLAQRAAADPGSLLVQSRVPREQLAEISAAFAGGFADASPLSRCSVCNVALVDASRDEVDVPPAVAAAHDAFRRCPACGRAYWEGTHVEEIRRRLLGVPSSDGVM